jgi:hypothetical protein
MAKAKRSAKKPAAKAKKKPAAKAKKKPAATKKPRGFPEMPTTFRAVFVDLAGNEVFGPFANATSFRDGFAAVRVGEVWGVIDTRGAFVVEPRFAEVGEVGGGLVAVRERGKVGYVDCTTGEFAIPPRFDFGLGFRGEHASVVTGGEIPEWSRAFQTQPSGGEWGIVDRAGALVVEMKHGGARASDGIAVVNHGGRASGFGDITVGGTFQYIDLAARKRIGDRYAGASTMSEDRACTLADGNSTEWTIIDRAGASIRTVDLETSATPGPFLSGRAVIDRQGGSFSRSKYALIDRDGNVILEDLGEALDLRDGVNVVNRGGEKHQGECRGGQWGFYGLDDTFVTRPEWTDIRAFTEGRGIVLTDAGCVVVDRAGDTVFAPAFHLFPFANGLALMRGPA